MKENSIKLDFAIPTSLESISADIDKISREAHEKIIGDIGSQLAKFILTHGCTDFYISDFKIVKNTRKDSNTFADIFEIKGELKVIDIKEAPQDQVEFHLQQSLLHAAHGLREHWRLKNCNKTD